ncbi:IS3 family transposase [Lysinibacillus sphaericus]|uniref:IS3 family transposase n=1 Tax=Lysinibacillus sphaericus TaxID=1421 RepID=UPI0025A2698E|nr:IS3 family transposase [Lysinibacillus sphaericus]MDM5353063.1 IS3 family transposase [Lysinibacillus sphaericus]
MAHFISNWRGTFTIYNNQRMKEKLKGMSPVQYEGTEKLQLVPLSEVFDDSIVEYLAFLIYN